MFLQRRLKCFYCGSSSHQKQKSGLRQWQCSTCKSTNYLDETGNITDPPASDVALPLPRYASRAKPITSAELTQSTEGIFCNTCVKNQYLFAHNLAEYLPDPEDPRYETYEKNLPKYRKSLETRYPQVCPKCEPRVRERLKLTGYAAKTDHLRRLAESTRDVRPSSNVGVGRRILESVGRAGWWLAHVSQVFWHARALSRLLSSSNQSPHKNFALSGRLMHMVGYWHERVDIDKLESLSGTMSLVLTVLSLWWNPVLSHGWNQGWQGVREFYKLQAVLLSVRAASWQLFDSRHIQDSAARRTIHAAALGFNLFVLVLSQRTIRAAPPPEISFEMSDDPLSLDDTRAPVTPKYHLEDTTFPIEKLRSAQSALRTWSSPPTPPPEDLSDDDRTIETETADSDAMDIDMPERMTMNWSPRKSEPLQSIIRQQEPSPFRGHLPPAPIGPAHKLRNPPNQPTFLKVSESRQKAFYDSVTKGRERQGNISSEQSQKTHRPDFRMAPPQFFASAQQETGLESLFTGLISLSDEPNEIREVSREGSATLIQPTPLSPIRLGWELGEMLIAVLAVSWAHFGELGPRWDFNLRTGVLAAIFIDSSLSFYSHISQSSAVWIPADILLCVVEMIFANGLLASHYDLWEICSLEQTLLQDVEKVLLWFFAAQKVFDCISNFARFPSFKSNKHAPKSDADCVIERHGTDLKAPPKSSHSRFMKQGPAFAHNGKTSVMDFGTQSHHRQAIKESLI